MVVRPQGKDKVKLSECIPIRIYQVYIYEEEKKNKKKLKKRCHKKKALKKQSPSKVQNPNDNKQY